MEASVTSVTEKCKVFLCKSPNIGSSLENLAKRTIKKTNKPVIPDDIKHLEFVCPKTTRIKKGSGKDGYVVPRFPNIFKSR